MDWAAISLTLNVVLVLGGGSLAFFATSKARRERAQTEAACRDAQNERASLHVREQKVVLEEAQLEAQSRELDCRLAATRDELKRELEAELAPAAVQSAQANNFERERSAKRALLATIQRSSATWTGENTTVMVKLPSDDVKGKLIGREGRNIKAFEQVTGTELIIDETPSVVTLSCFDPRRRLLAQLTLTNLVLDGRIHPARIEEIHTRAEAELESNLVDIGEEAAGRAGVSGLSARVLTHLGALKFRGSGGQNVLEHSVEAAQFAAVLAAEIACDVIVARRAALLHDIGKALGPEWGGAHALAGMSFLQAQGESAAVAEAVGAHHYDVPPESAEAQIVIVADSMSGSRPGARSAQEAVHLSRLAKLEALASGLLGVERATAYDSGRDLRVFVRPEQVDDLGAVRLAKQVARVVKASGEYPGPVKVTVIRETRAIEVSE